MPRLAIGDFSRMTFLSIKALRYYQDVGLLVPASIDSATGYRRYDVAQVATAQVIRRLRDLGMPVEEVRAVLRAPDVSARNAAIIAHLGRMERALQQTQETVASLRKLLEGGPAPAKIELRTLPARRALAIRKTIGGADVERFRRDGFRDLRAILSSLGYHRAGPDSALYTSELLEQEHGEVTVFIPVMGGVRKSTDGRLVEVPLDACEVACITHVGPLDSIDQSFAALGTYVSERAIGVEGPMLESYLVGALDSPDERDHRTEIGWPIFRTRP